jgi:hypothetical protein
MSDAKSESDGALALLSDADCLTRKFVSYLDKTDGRGWCSLSPVLFFLLHYRSSSLFFLTTHTHRHIDTHTHTHTYIHRHTHTHSLNHSIGSLVLVLRRQVLPFGTVCVPLLTLCALLQEPTAHSADEAMQGTGASARHGP